MTASLSIPGKLDPKLYVSISLLLFVGQMASDTDLSYAFLVLIFALVTGASVNVLGGLSDLRGFSVCIMALKIVIVSQFVKIFMGQPGNSNLEVPTTTMGVLLLGLLSILAAAAITRRFRSNNPLLVPLINPQSLRSLALIAFAIGGMSYSIAFFFGTSTTTGEINVGGIFGVARNLTSVLALSIVAGTAYKITASEGKESFGLIVFLPMVVCFVFGVFSLGKQAMLDPILYYGLTCLAFRFSFRARHLLALGAFAVFAVLVIFPYAQVGRSLIRSESASDRIVLAGQFIEGYFTDVGSIEDVQKLVVAVVPGADRFWYFGKPMGYLDRFALIEPVDELVNATITDGTSGWETITHGFRMLLPRVINPNKPIYNTGNFLGHRIGIVGPEDFSTQISFGFIANSFNAFSWTGAFVIPFLLMIAFFGMYGKLAGPLDRNIWTVFLFGMLQHDFVEETVTGIILFLINRTLLLIVLYFVLIKLVTFVERRMAANSLASRVVSHK